MATIYIAYSSSFSNYTFANLSENEQQGQIITTSDESFNEDDEIEVPLFEEEDESSNILFFLSDKNDVVIIERLDVFSLIEYIEEIDGEEPQIWRGYVNNKYLMDVNNDESDEVDVDEEPEIETEVDEDSNIDQTDEDPNKTVEHDDKEHEKKPDESKQNPDETVINSNEKFTKKINIALSNNQTIYYGIGLKDRTNVYKEQSRDSKILKSYPIGTILKYYSLNTNWYGATVFINGKAETGYIHKSDVENTVKNQKVLAGIAGQSPTHVFANPSTGAKSLKTYAAGSILKYRTFSENWYHATVYVKGKRETGYIHKSHVENAVDKQKSLTGIASQSPTHVFANPSTSAKSLKTYAAGSILKYRTFSENWYQATVSVKGKWETGYIHKSHVENAVDKQQRLTGIASQSPTRIFAKPSTSANSLKTYAAGSILKYRTYSENWYQATVSVKGKWETGYIHKSHVENVVDKQVALQGVGIGKPTHVYKAASTSSSSLKSYKYGSILKYKTFTSEWYEATIKLNGEWETGYIHKNDIVSMDFRFEGFAQKNPTYVYSDTSTKSKVLKSYPRGSRLIYRAFNKDWYVATVKINGNWETGYIYVKDVNDELLDLIYHTNYNYDFKEMVDRQASKKPNADGGGKIEATRGQIEFYTNPLNFPTTTDEYFQFLVLSQPAGLTANQINHSILNDNAGVLKGQGQAFIDAGRELKINEIYLISHALHETGNGKSTLAKGIPVDKDGHVTKDANGNLAQTATTKHIVYNMFGNGAKTECPIDCGAMHAFKNKWFTVKDAIVGGIGDISLYINRGQDTLYKMRWNPIGGIPNPPVEEWRQYATHIQWATITTKRIAQMYELLEDYTLEFDVPTFNKMPDYTNGAPAIVTANSLNFRSGPGTNYGEIGSIPEGAEVRIIGSNVNAWYNIKYNGQTGWVSAQYVHLKY